MRSYLRRLARRVLTSQAIPFDLRSRLKYSIATRKWNDPTTFREKVLWKMAKDRRPLLTVFADKVAVREYVRRVVGPTYLKTLYGVLDDPGKLPVLDLPDAFVVKANHGWDMNVFCLRKSAVDWGPLVDTCRRWLSLDYSDRPDDVNLEWAYRDIPRRILVEEYLEDPGGLRPYDYKLSVFHGRVRMIRVDVHDPERRANFYWPDWSQIDVEGWVRRTTHPIPCPSRLGDMIRIAELLGQETDFVRVDLYQIGQRLVFGELTNYPAAGELIYSDPKFDALLGSFWRIPRWY
jgi:hypothetical protein